MFDKPTPSHALILSLGMLAVLGCSSGPNEPAEPAPAPKEPQSNPAMMTCGSGSSSASSNGSVGVDSCGWGCTDTCSSQVIGEPGGPFYCSNPTSCGIWPWCPTATVTTGPLDTPQCECVCK